jgi:hypothetical protein
MSDTNNINENVKELRRIGWVHGFYGTAADPVLRFTQAYADAYTDGRSQGHPMARPYDGA